MHRGMPAHRRIAEHRLLQFFMEGVQILHVERREKADLPAAAGGRKILRPSGVSVDIPPVAAGKPLVDFIDPFRRETLGEIERRHGPRMDHVREIQVDRHWLRLLAAPENLAPPGLGEMGKRVLLIDNLDGEDDVYG